MTIPKIQKNVAANMKANLAHCRTSVSYTEKPLDLSCSGADMEKWWNMGKECFSEKKRRLKNQAARARRKNK